MIAYWYNFEHARVDIRELPPDDADLVQYIPPHLVKDYQALLAEGMTPRDAYRKPMG